MIARRGSEALVVSLAVLALSGCVAAVPAQPTLTVIPGQGKTEANLRADDAACRGVPVTTSTATTIAPASQAALATTAEQYYACMASRGEAVIQEQPQPYPVYAGYAPYGAPAYTPYPYYGYPYGYGYPYAGPYYGPFVGFGVGFGYGRFYRGGGGWHGGGYGWHGGGWHGGGWRR